MYEVESLFPKNGLDPTLPPQGKGDTGYAPAGGDWERPANSDQVIESDGLGVGRGSKKLDGVAHSLELPAKVGDVSDHTAWIGEVVR